MWGESHRRSGRPPSWQAGGYDRARAATVCKTVGSAYVGSNPTPATTKPAGQAWYRAILRVGSGSGLRYRCGYLADREDSVSGQVGAVVPRPGGELHSRGVARRGRAVVEPGSPRDGQDRVWSYAAALICLLQPGVPMHQQLSLRPVATEYQDGRAEHAACQQVDGAGALSFTDIASPFHRPSTGWRCGARTPVNARVRPHMASPPTEFSW
jgi:hypothetical protein